MNSSTLKIASAALGGSGILVGGGVGIYHHLNKGSEKKDETAPERQEEKGKPISEWLTNDNLTLLNNAEDDAQWKANWGQFVTDQTTDTLPEGWNVNDWSNKKLDKEAVPADFKTNCEKNSKEVILKKGEGNYSKVARYCTKGTTPKSPDVAK